MSAAAGLHVCLLHPNYPRASSVLITPLDFGPCWSHVGACCALLFLLVFPAFLSTTGYRSCSVSCPGPWGLHPSIVCLLPERTHSNRRQIYRPRVSAAAALFAQIHWTSQAKHTCIRGRLHFYTTTLLYAAPSPRTSKLKLTAGPTLRAFSQISSHIDNRGDSGGPPRTRQLQLTSLLRSQNPKCPIVLVSARGTPSHPCTNEPSHLLPTCSATAPHSSSVGSGQCSQLEDPRTCDSPVPLLGSVEAESRIAKHPKTPVSRAYPPDLFLLNCSSIFRI